MTDPILVQRFHPLGSSKVQNVYSHNTSALDLSCQDRNFGRDRGAVEKVSTVAENNKINYEFQQQISWPSVQALLNNILLDGWTY